MSDLVLAAIADIHGNRWALEAVLEDIQRRGIKRIVNLGDSLLGPLDPTGTAQLLMQRHILAIRGNDDRVLFAPPAVLSPSIIYSLAHVTPDALDWLRNLPATDVVADEIFLCHGTPTSDDSYLLEEVKPTGVSLRATSSIAADVADITQPVILCAHSHTTRTVMLPNGKLIVNPGSVGLPAYRDDGPLLPHGMESGSPHARYAILSKESTGWQVQHIHLPYNWDAAISAANAHQRPDWAHWLTGRVS